MLQHGGGGEDGDDGHQVGEEPKHPETGEQHSLTPKLTLLPGLRKYYKIYFSQASAVTLIKTFKYTQSVQWHHCHGTDINI